MMNIVAQLYVLGISSVFSFIGLIFILEKIFKLSQRESALLSAPGLIFLLFLGSLFHVLHETASFLYLAGMISFIWNGVKIVIFKKYQENIIVILLAAYFILFLTVFLLFNFHFTYGDEFSFWGSSAKYIKITGHLLDEYAPIAYKDYPPGSALFQYFFQSPFKQFSETISYFAQSVIWVLPLFSIIEKNRKLTQFSCCLILIVILLHFYEIAFFSLYIDATLGAYFAGILINYYISCEKNEKKYWSIVSAPLLVFLKPAGIFFFIVFIFTAAVMALSYYFKNKQKKLIRSDFLNLAVTLFFGLFIFILWKHYYSVFSKPTLGSWGLSSMAHPRNDVTSIFVKALFHEAFILILYIFSLNFFSFLKQKGWGAKIIIIALNISLFVGFIFYAAGIYILYTYHFSEYEALRLASFDRYISIYLSAYMMVAVYIFLNSFISFLEGKKIMFFLTASILFIVTMKGGIQNRNSFNHDSLRSHINEVYEKVQKNMHYEKKTPIYLIILKKTASDYSDDIPKEIYNYTFLPFAIKAGCFTLEEGFSKKMNETCLSLRHEKDLSLLLNRKYFKKYNHAYVLVDLAEPTQDIPSNFYQIEQKNGQNILEKIF